MGMVHYFSIVYPSIIFKSIRKKPLLNSLTQPTMIQRKGKSKKSAVSRWHIADQHRDAFQTAVL